VKSPLPQLTQEQAKKVREILENQGLL